jgi:hypothetical protein
VNGGLQTEVPAREVIQQQGWMLCLAASRLELVRGNCSGVEGTGPAAIAICGGVRIATVRDFVRLMNSEVFS